MGSLLMTPPPGPNQVSPWWMQMLPLVFIVGIFYFLLFRPARKRQKQVQQMIENLKPGDKVITSGGVLGTVAAVDRNVVQLRIADKVKIDITKSSVVGLQEPGGSMPTEG